LPESFISELKARNPLEQVAGRYVSFKRSGSNLVACCPFHSERTPSFTLYSPGDHFHCFGCGAGGDVITFVMRIENLDYMSAVEYLADMAGMRMPETGDRGERRADKNRFYEMNKKAARYFHEKLLSPDGRQALSYLTERGVTPEMIRHFGLGYAGNDFEALTGFLMREGFSGEEMKTGFLCGISERTKRPYDYFRGRVMFPIIDTTGKVCAFGGRIIGNGVPKYLNSSDTPVFKKSRTLFALNFARASAQERLILCEGYMDVIALHGAGFTNAVATLGTAITPDQARLMRKYTQNVVVCYDSDDAGKAAAKRAIGILKEADVSVKVLSLKGAKDPDEFIKNYGRGAFEKALTSATGHIDYIFNDTLAGYNMESPEDRLSFAKDICRVLSGVESDLEKEVYLGKVTQLTGIDTGVLRRELARRTKKNEKETKLKRTENDIRTLIGYGDRVNPEKIKYPAACSKEEGIIGVLLMHPEYMGDDSVKECVRPDDFVTAFNRKAVTEIRRIYSELSEKAGGAGGDGGFDFSYLNETMTPEEVGALMKMRVAREELADNGPGVLRELADSLAEEKRKAGSSGVSSASELAERLRDLKEGRSRRGAAETEK